MDKTPQTALPPDDYETLIRVIHERYDTMSKTSQKIAVFLTQNPNEVAMMSVNAIARKCGVHASSFVRFAQTLGYQGFKELQGVFHKRLSTAAPGFDARVKALEHDLEKTGEHTGLGFLRELVVRDIASLQDLIEHVEEEALQTAVQAMQGADTIYVAGQLRSAPVAEIFRYVLTMLGKRVILLDPGGGLATQMARTMGDNDLLIAIAFRFYAKEVVRIAEDAQARGLPVVAISDTTLSPLAKTATVLFPIPEHDYTFSRSLAAPMCLAQALMVALAARLQDDETAPRIPIATQS